jgi:hypothetical protein
MPGPCLRPTSLAALNVSPEGRRVCQRQLYGRYFAGKPHDSGERRIWVNRESSLFLLLILAPKVAESFGP